jgi:hypothetical protein
MWLTIADNKNNVATVCFSCYYCWLFPCRIGVSWMCVRTLPGFRRSASRRHLPLPLRLFVGQWRCTKFQNLSFLQRSTWHSGKIILYKYIFIMYITSSKKEEEEGNTGARQSPPLPCWRTVTGFSLCVFFQKKFSFFPNSFFFPFISPFT